MPRIRSIRQHDQSDCGTACLASVAAYYGLHIPLARIRDYASTDAAGTNVLGLTEAAEKLGFTAKGVKGPFEALQGAPMPAIAHIALPDQPQHFVVLVSCGRRKVRYMDPGDGRFVREESTQFRKQWSGVLILLTPGKDFLKARLKTSRLKRFLQLGSPFRATLVQALCGALVYSLLGLSTSVYVQKIMDFVLLNQNMNILALMSIAMIVLLCLRSLIGYLKNLFLLKTGHQIDGGLMMGYYRHLLHLPQKFFDRMRTGEILSRMSDAIKIRQFISYTLLELVVGVTTILLTLIAMALLSWKLCLLISMAIPLYALIYYLYDRFNRYILRKTMEQAAELESQIVESLGSNQLVRVFGLQDHFIDRTEYAFIQFLRSSYRAGRAAIRSGQSAEILSGLATVTLLWAGSVYVSNQNLTPGELMSFYTMMGYLLRPVAGLTGFSRSVRDANIAADRLFEILDLEHEKNHYSGMELTHVSGKIEFRDVSFRYGTGPELFRGLNMIIEAGSWTGIVGRSGSGKSSIASMIMALYHPHKGNILLDGWDLKQLNTGKLRCKISIVPQQIDLFSGSILENIAPGEGDPDTPKIIQLAEQTGLIHLLNILPDGIYTQLGEKGLSLSGGERQRIAIARALYRDPSILILDEATSALDPVSARDILRLLASFQRNGMTLIVIAHKLKTISHADQIFLLDAGRVSESGNHNELMLMQGKYRHFWEIQNG